uniref:Sister chromatid cohesion protein DCC1 n=1 Tax=Chaetoceros debilis TaxID=122233 RepID=A0A7S3V637_9STRA|mmetsp:Transcript_11826/g.17932  ORF Transcript_11826/g.17932 Transcript_11826/m.17932 type:complete len:451 (-) Transcript_11826:108-1460(-)|eukprot:CAMPEP_0194085476 /NCGR_PEP_ID=MMETSP0149-20130528/17598_1 /TAXON_ID=122233 /ORGANISM="Chaetoceros debilis, Strain MM31A-1" /LENGTH=450 /DNA_ID=CAMNT_0038768367 /DNA_START=73 /DNA_END=1425 /DNA_ORIENTATION=-
MSKRKHPLENKTLKVSKTDFPSLSRTTNGNTDKSSQLLLVQLPPTLSLDELTKSSRFIIQEGEDKDKCRLISEGSEGKTFDLVRVETSNSYIMVKHGTDIRKDDDVNDNDDSQNKKKANARLLRESNTFFLECIENKDNLEIEVERILKKHVYPDDRKGITLNEIEKILMHSTSEIKNVLKKMMAFPIPCTGTDAGTDTDTERYGVVSEEVERETWFIIVSVLSEWDGAIDYAGKGVHLEAMVQEVMKRKEDNDDLEDCVVRFCLRLCMCSISSDNNNNGKSESEDHGHGLVKLGVDYIARILAHSLFNAMTAPWKERDFHEEWCKLMPGVGDIYEPSLELLKGIALVQTKSEVEAEMGPGIGNTEPEPESAVYLKYFPRDRLPSDAKDRCKILFREKKTWKADEIIPYLTDIVEKSSSSFSSVQELLVRHATVVNDVTDDGAALYYMSK